VSAEPLDIGCGHTLTFTRWSPDRDLNPQYAGLPDIDPVGALIEHTTSDGKECTGYVHFNSEATRRVFPDDPVWIVEKWEPLTLSPSILCKLCGDHGFIEEGRWRKA
jgi:hypothetical protein